MSRLLFKEKSVTQSTNVLHWCLSAAVSIAVSIIKLMLWIHHLPHLSLLVVPDLVPTTMSLSSVSPAAMSVSIICQFSSLRRTLARCQSSLAFTRFLFLSKFLNIQSSQKPELYCGSSFWKSIFHITCCHWLHEGCEKSIFSCYWDLVRLP